jgi:hypothetical protein
VWAEIRRYHGDSSVPETTVTTGARRDSILTRPTTAGIAALEVEFRNLREVCNCYFDNRLCNYFGSRNTLPIYITAAIQLQQYNA